MASAVVVPQGIPFAAVAGQATFEAIPMAVPLEMPAAPEGSVQVLEDETIPVAVPVPDWEPPEDAEEVDLELADDAASEEDDEDETAA